MPRVSVVTCTYNRAHLIGETIRSVLAQSFQDFEYIIIDDGSNDGTEQLIRSIADKRIRYFYVVHSGRLSQLRNYSHAKCSGEFIAYVDSDDIWDPSKLEKQVTAMERNPAAGFSFSDIETFDKNGVLKKSLYNLQGAFHGNVFQRMLQNKLVICHTTLMIRKACIDSIGQSDESFYAGDHDFVFRMSHSYDAAVLYEPLVKVRKHDQNTTGNHSYDLKGYAEHHRTLRKLLDLKKISSEEYLDAVQVSSYAFGQQLTAAGDHGTAFRYFTKSLAIKPWDARSLVRACQSLAKKIFAT
jgi:glycosyltransferase involved in cell wall biosynthesis